ncbi:cytochrome c oxidase cbb3-type subunit 4 [Rhizobium subbaraonis]|uniref:Cytochrome c oxidase cbb3-type subunit 4 n=1 Tax=Rhizobium subbaraonis TaxID=908946 RepID=A0A285UQN2_9HYPH|nr:cbb3-type cytochrome c oxidase subunit 3 [Rhizobium subbaraonis]SOC42966.1 cytochrome c oxidase cbb3-type subunit 4 [Rhizobium subbaraonis]
MSFDHDTVTGFAKSFGLFYLIAMSIGVIIYAYWPANRKQFDHAAHSIISDDEDRPCP